MNFLLISALESQIPQFSEEVHRMWLLLEAEIF